MRSWLLYWGEEPLAVSASVLDGAAALGKVGAVLQRFELGLRIRSKCHTVGLRRADIYKLQAEGRFRGE
jgi:hypothetical protein